MAGWAAKVVLVPARSKASFGLQAMPTRGAELPPDISLMQSLISLRLPEWSTQCPLGATSGPPNREVDIARRQLVGSRGSAGAGPSRSPSGGVAADGYATLPSSRISGADRGVLRLAASESCACSRDQPP